LPNRRRQKMMAFERFELRQAFMVFENYWY
jgi:hypothetical protein